MATSTIKNITPANIGAVAKAGDTMTGPLNIRGDLSSYDLEFKQPVGSGIGGYIDFRYNGEEVDYTSRIIENHQGVLDVNGVTFQNGNLTGKTNGYGWEIDTENTYSTWVPVLDNGTLKHRVLSAWLNNMDIVPVDHGGTGATTEAEARNSLGITPNNIGAFDLGLHYIDIPSGANLDNYTTPGNYALKSGVQPTEVSGKPYTNGYAFSLRVVYPLRGTWYKAQYFISYSDGHTWYRIWDNSWGNWTQLF